MKQSQPGQASAEGYSPNGFILVAMCRRGGGSVNPCTLGICFPMRKKPLLL